MVFAACSPAPVADAPGSDASARDGGTGPLDGAAGDADQAAAFEPLHAAERSRVAQPVRGVVLIVADTLRADRLGCYGYPRDTSPNIDALAKRGGLWRRNVTQGMWTVPAMLSLMTGRELVRSSNAVPRDVPTLAQLVSEAGVETAAFVGNPVAGASRGLARGFDHYEVDETGATDATEWVERFIAWQEARVSTDRPWFVWLQFMDTHTPYDPTESDRRFARSTPRVGQDELDARWNGARAAVERINADHPQSWSFDRARALMIEQSNLYDGEVVTVDRAVGSLVESLEERGSLDDTLIVFAADHGEMLWEVVTHHYLVARRRARDGGGLGRGLVDLFASGHTFWFHPPVAMTPMILHGPGVPGGVHDELSANLDIVPTVLEAFGLDPLDTAQGFSKLRPSAPRDVVFGRGRLGVMALAENGLQLVHMRERSSTAAADPEWEFRLRDHTSPDWHVERSADRPADFEVMKQRLEDWREGPSLPPVEKLDEGALEALRRFGYVDDDE